MENKTARPVGSHHSTTRANINQPIAAAKDPKPWERSLYPRAAPIASRSKETPTTTGSEIPTPGPSRRYTSSAPIHSRPGPASRPARNLQGVSGTGGATPFAARPSMRGRAVRDVGFENWAFRNESIMAHPVRAPLRGRPSRIPSAIPEEDEESDVLPALPSPTRVPTTSEMKMRWQGETARRSPAMVHAGAAPVHSQVGSLVAATESPTPAIRHSWPKRNPRPAVLPSSPLRHSIGHAPEIPPRTYLDMHARYERAPTRLMRKSPSLDYGDNFSPFCAGTTARDIRRRAGLGLKVPLPGNAVLERRVFAAPFVDAPTVIGGRREMRGVERERVRMRGEAEAGGSEAVSAPTEGEKEEGKKGWQRVSAFLANKMSLKAKGAASPSASPATSSPQTPPNTPPALVYDGSSRNASPARAPATPPQVRFATPMVVSGPPTSTPRKATAEKKKHPVSPPSPLKTALKRPSPPCSQPPQREHFTCAVTAASALTPCRNYTSLPTADEEEEEQEEGEERSPLSDVDDTDVFPSPQITSKRWARPGSLRHEAVADALAEETAAADWAGTLKQAERVRYVGKGKGRMVDVTPR